MEVLTNYELSSDPFASFEHWYALARATVPKDPGAFILSTVSKEGIPSSRTVLFKGFHEKQFTFYTNYEGRKSQEILENPHVSMVFYWHNLERQIRIQGRVTKAPRPLSEKYFHSRSIGSQVAASISKQSNKVLNREEMLKTFHDFEASYVGKVIPCPVNWGGFMIEPQSFEFFLLGEFRLSDRFLYTRNPAAPNDWKIERLWP